MSRHLIFPVLLGLGLIVGCEPVDSDGDGVSDEDEEALGLDPEIADSDGDGIDDGAEGAFGSNPALADSDGDGLMDGDEQELGTDPTSIDSDGDTYRDGDEVVEGTDPLLKSDRIYKGYWPYNVHKEEMVQNHFGDGEEGKLNKQFGRFVGRDQFEEEVDLYDFATAGVSDPDGTVDDKFVLFDLSGVWCYWCNELADFMSGSDSTALEPVPECWHGLRDAVNNGEIYYVSVLDYGMSSEITEDDVVEWDDDYPIKPVPVLMDQDMVIMDYVHASGYPTVWLLDPELKVEDNGDYYPDVLNSAAEAIGEHCN
jgi:hypothetical protein